MNRLNKREKFNPQKDQSFGGLNTQTLKKEECIYLLLLCGVFSETFKTCIEHNPLILADIGVPFLRKKTPEEEQKLSDFLDSVNPLAKRGVKYINDKISISRNRIIIGDAFFLLNNITEDVTIISNCQLDQDKTLELAQIIADSMIEDLELTRGIGAYN